MVSVTFLVDTGRFSLEFELDCMASIWMVGALLSFMMIGIGAKELAHELSIFQILLMRSLVGLGIIGGIIFLQRKINVLQELQKIKLHLFRNFCHFSGQYAWYISIGLIPLAEVFALEFTMPLWTIGISVLFLGETFTRRKVVTALLGLVGVLLIVKPGFGTFEVGFIFGLLAAFLFSCTHVSMKVLVDKQPILLVLLMMCIIQACIGAVFSIHNLSLPVGIEWFWILVIGVASLSAHFCLGNAVKSAEASQILILDFLRMPLIAIVGYLFYEETVDVYVFLGAGIIVLASLINIGVGRGFFSRIKT